MTTVNGQFLLLAQGGVHLVSGIALFVVMGVALALGALVFGRLLRPHLPHPVKEEAYECGEPVVGSAWVQFDLRFYVVALVFLVFDVEIALFWPWAVVYGGGAHPGASLEAMQQVRQAALFDMLFFFGVIVVGFVYLWRFGYLDWVRAITGGREESKPGTDPVLAPPPAPKGVS